MVEWRRSRRAAPSDSEWDPRKSGSRNARCALGALVARPQCRPPAGSRHEKVSSSGSSRAQLHHVPLVERGQRTHQLDVRRAAARSMAACEGIEKIVGGIGKRIAAQRAEGQLRDAVQPAPDVRP